MERQNRGKDKKESLERVLEMKRVLMNAIKMQALYSGRKIKIVDTSDLIH